MSGTGPPQKREYRRGVELNPNSADARLYLAWFLEGTGRLSEALKAYQRARWLDPEEDHLSEGLAAQGEYHVRNEMLPLNPLGLTITYFREDQAFKE